MNSTRKKNKKAVMLAAASALAILLTSCQSAAPNIPNSNDGNLTPQQTVDAGKADSPQKSYSERDEIEIQTGEPTLNKVDLSSNTTAETSNLRKPGDTKAAVKTESKDKEWLVETPLLHQIAIGDSHAAIVKLYGKPLDSYKLEEETEPITVLEYEGFAVGINALKKVQFIEVFGENISAGLNGLKIGDDSEAALLALGKPEKQTAYLLTYKAKGALLKLDLDPDQNQILSIKLLVSSS